MDKNYLKSEFEEWIKSQKQPNGKPYSLKSIKQNYISALEKSTKKLQIPDLSESDLFYYSNPDEFKQVYEKILAHPNFKEIDKAAGNGAYSCSMKLYMKFLEENLTGISNIDLPEIMGNDDILKYLIEQSKLVEGISTPEGLLANKDKLNLNDLIAKYSNDNGKINKIKFEILKKLENNKVFSLEELLDIKKQNAVTSGMYETYLSYTYTFVGDNPRKQLKIICKNLLNDLGIVEEYTFTPSPFDGVRNSGEKTAWLLLHPKAMDFRDSWQFFVSISPDGIECGKHSGRNLFENYVRETQGVSSYEEILKVLSRHKEEIMKLNKDLNFQKQPIDNIKKLTWWQISAIAMYLNNKHEKYKPVDVENLSFTQNAKKIKGQIKPSIATELRECSDDITSKYNRKSKNCFNRLGDFYKLSQEGIEYIENDLKEFLNYNNEHKGNIQMTKKDIPLNQILYGPPGTGKTYNTAIEALKIVMPENDYISLDLENREEVMKEYKKYKKNDRIKFVTFHQSYSYEEFVEGIKPVLGDECPDVKYEIKDGILKQIADFATTENIQSDAKFDFNPDNDVFKISLGDSTKEEDAEIYDYCMENNVIALGWGRNIDFSNANSEQDIKNIFDKNKDNSEDQSAWTIQAIKIFKLWMKKDDLIFVSKGNKFVRAIGRVADSGYIYNPDTEIRYSQFKKVEWLLKDVEIPIEKLYERNLSQQSIYMMFKGKIKFDNLNELIGRNISKQVKNYVLIIDEINRGNISKIFGELITLLEEDKRLGKENELTVSLPYSGNKKEFGLPSNLYIIGTMNTSDRSIASVDIALRRRFKFVEIMPDSSLVNVDVQGVKLREIFENLNQKISILLDRDHQIGHSYFIDVDSKEKLERVWFDNIIPLLNEYFYGEWDKLQAILGDFISVKPVPPVLKDIYDDNQYYDFKKPDEVNFMQAIKKLENNAYNQTLVEA